jgi:hypothetical protein
VMEFSVSLFLLFWLCWELNRAHAGQTLALSYPPSLIIPSCVSPLGTLPVLSPLLTFHGSVFSLPPQPWNQGGGYLVSPVFKGCLFAQDPPCSRFADDYWFCSLSGMRMA